MRINVARRSILVVAVLAGAIMLAGCGEQPPVSNQSSAAFGSPTADSAAPTPAASAPTNPAPAAPAPTTPVLVPNGTAAANRAFFDSVNNALFSSNGSANGRTIIDNLVASGFDRATMQVTPDKTPTNGTVDSILFAVKMKDSCLVGQHGGAGYSSSVIPALENGGCLIGKTRAIDW